MTQRETVVASESGTAESDAGGQVWFHNAAPASPAFCGSPVPTQRGPLD